MTLRRNLDPESLEVYHDHIYHKRHGEVHHIRQPLVPEHLPECAAGVAPGEEEMEPAR